MLELVSAAKWVEKLARVLAALWVEELVCSSEQAWAEDLWLGLVKADPLGAGWA